MKKYIRPLSRLVVIGSEGILNSTSGIDRGTYTTQDEIPNEVEARGNEMLLWNEGLMY